MDKVKHFLELARKHHFWILCGVSAFVGLVVWYMSTSQLAAEFTSGSSKIKSVQQGLTVAGEQPHLDWSGGMTEEANKVRKSVWAAWNHLYNEQKEHVFVWPKNLLKAEFIEATPRLDGDNPSMPRELREYYGDRLKIQVRDLAKTVDAAPLDEAAATTQSANGQTVSAIDHKVAWASLQDIADSFDWTEPQSPMLVKYAQEELWVYKALCQIIAEVNKDATGSHDAPINEITEMSIAYNAAEDSFGGQGEKRVEEIADSAGGAPAEQSSGSGDAAARPLRPTPKTRGKKNGDTRQSLAGGAGGADAASSNPDVVWKRWRYVFATEDKKGQPMMEGDVDSSKDDEYHLMPFRLVLKLDPHYLDRLLVACRNSPLPIEVQQVRMGSQVSGGGLTSNGGMVNGKNLLSSRYASSSSERGDGGSAAAANLTSVQHERTEGVDIRGVVYLLNKPDPKKLHLNANGEVAGSEEQATPAATETPTVPPAEPPAAAN
jgi:hypothetical protein